jgi:starch-binding outer membrane protein, SusD/RagB family
MKKTIWTMLLLAGGWATLDGCQQNTLDLTPSLATEDTYFQTPTQFREGVLGVYSKLVFFYNYRGGNYLQDSRLLSDDDLTSAGNNPFDVFASVNAGNGKVSDNYRFLYQVINRANSIIEQLDNKGKEAFGTDTKTPGYIRSEALFLRAYANFQLWNLYGTAPVVTTRTSVSTDLSPGNSKDTDLLDQAIRDLIAAAPTAIDTWPAGDVGRITSGAINALLGKAYLYRATVKKAPADYTAALAAFNLIKGYTLQKAYSDNFRQDKENNSESLFEIQLGKSSQPNNVWLNTDDFSGNGDISGYWGFFDNNFSLFGTPRFVPTKPFLAAFDKTDPRYYNTLDSAGATVVKYVQFAGGDPATSSGVAYFNNSRVIRLSDVKLMQAEALIQSGGSTTTALALINEVRKRARESAAKVSALPADRPATETNRTRLMQWVIEERRLELAFEEGTRWYDLRRWQLGGVLRDVYAKDLTSWDFGAQSPAFKYTNNNLYLPLPSSELALNANLKQNPGY